MNIALNMDCMEAMKEMSDNAFDLAVVDPPYGDGLDGGGNPNRFGERFDRYKSANLLGTSGWQDGRQMGGEVWKKIVVWDIAPGKEYFKELFRVSRNQIIWGGNYFELPRTRCFLVWRKTNVPENFTMAMAEYAWTSFNANAKVFNFSAVGIPGRFHPTQKPVELYDWIFRLYAKPGYKILDTHLGSGSSRIAAWKAGLDFKGFEIDEQYYKLSVERFEKFTMQGMLF